MLRSAAMKCLRWWPIGLAMSGLLACSTPLELPPLPAASVPPAGAASPPTAARVTAPPAAPAVVAAPYGPAVAARFPDPPVTYRTPAFEAGHAGFTSNAELRAAMDALAREGQGDAASVRLLSLGSSQQGVPLEALLFTRSAEADPLALRQAGRPTVLLIGQQHGDEPAGCEALLVVAQELAGGRLAPLLEQINVIVMPRANPDGAQAQRRVTASGIDLNRDHLLLKTPEAQALAQLSRDYRPVAVVDLHEYTVTGRYLEKFGSVQRFDALLQYAMTANLPEFVTEASEKWFRQPVIASLKSAGLSTEWYYSTSSDPADNKVSMGGVQPDTGRNVDGLRNAMSLLIETRGVGLGRLHLKRRVFTHVSAVESVLASAARRAADLVKLRSYVDDEVSAKACKGDMVVDAAATPSEYNLLMLDPVTGADKTVTVVWDSALELRPLKTRPRPCGYWLAADQTDAVLRLRGLGLSVQQVAEPGVMRGETFRETARSDGVRQDVRGAIADGGGIVRVQVETQPALIDVAPGSFYVPLDQPFANLAVAALEPDTQNSYLAHRILTDATREVRVTGPPEVRMTAVP